MIHALSNYLVTSYVFTENPRDQNKLGINETKADIVKMPKWCNNGPVSPSDERSL